jgi:acetyl esterase/lipase
MLKNISMIKRPLVSILLLVSLVWTSSAQESAILQEKLVYKVIAGHELSVDMFYAEAGQKSKNSTAIAFFHGGGWVFGAPSEFFEACRRYAKKGYATFSFQYRLSRNSDGTYPNPDISPIESVKDARSAIRWIRAHADSLNIDPEKIVVGGQSAGGQLALSTALMDSINESTDDLDISPKPNALLLFSSNVNTLEPWIDMLLGDRHNNIWSISPYHNLKKSMPPAIAFHGEEDNQVLPYIVRMFKDRIDEMGNYYDLHWYPGRKHYLGEGNEKYARYFNEDILELTDAFLENFGF